jgi:ribosomal protein S24E
MEEFTNLFSLSKTLRFELRPEGKTLEFINKNGLLVQDKHRAESYIKVKDIIDKYHKAFIENALRDFRLNYDDIEAYYSYYIIRKREETQKKQFAQVQSSLRKQIADCFKKNDSSRLFGKELIKEDLIEFVKTEEDRLMVKEFKDFTTYFTGFHENRKNMYSEEEKSTSIAYRLINENLPKFIDNISIFERVKTTEVTNDLKTLYSDMEEYLNVLSIDELFNLKYFTEVLTQTQIDVYNAIIGGKSFDDGRKIKGLNEYINLYNQNQKEKKNRLPKLKPLFKQILSDRNAISYIPDEFKSDNEVLSSIEKVYQDLNQEIFNKERIGEYSLKDLLLNIKSFELDKIYVRNELALTEISQKQLGKWDIVNKGIINYYITNNPKKVKEKQEKYDEKVKKYLKSFDSYSIQFINDCLEDKTKKIEDYFIQCKNKDDKNLFEQIETNYNAIKDLLNTDYPENKKLSQDKESVEKIKIFLDSIKELQWFIKPLLEKGEIAEKDERFYGEFSSMWKLLDDSITPLYNKVRNYITKKPYSQEKIQLFFQNKGQFLGGWVDSKTEHSDNGTQAGGYLFRKKNDIGEYDYYLGVSSDSKLFRNSDINNGKFERLDYYQPKSMSIYGNSYIGGNYNEDKLILIDCIKKYIEQISDSTIKQKINNEFLKIKEETPSLLLNTLKTISYNNYKELFEYEPFKDENKRVTKNLKDTILTLNRIPKSKQYYNIEFNSFVEAQKAIEELCKEKVFNYFLVSDNEMETLQNRLDNPLLLFKITNKDLSFAETYIEGKRKSRGIDNLHTMFFKLLMSGSQNTLDIGTGKVFYRKKSLNYSEEIYQKGHHYNTLKDKFHYPIISNKRYCYDKFQFHLSIFQNYQQPKSIITKDFNQNVNQYIKENKVKHIIGIDRGERHLLYLSLIDLKGNIIKQFSLNEIINEYKGGKYKTNYRDLLNKKEVDRDEARKNWQTIENIKELKEGYLSQVIHKISELMIEYNAIVVLEDLNSAFMRGRQKVEKQVYQKFEKMLIDKLNYLVDKKKDPNEKGGLLNAYQLTSKFESFQKLGKQSGFLFYVPAWNTSKIDPTTGFVNLFDTRYENREKTITFFDKFKRIEFNKAKDYFEFEFDYSKFTTKAEGTKTNWTICTNSTRIETFRNKDKNSQWDNKEIVLSQAFKDLFDKYMIEYKSNLKANILSQDRKEFFEELLHLLKLTLQMRNSKTGTDIDYLISPVANQKGVFYDSRVVNDTLPKNADANGAYNIARKGLWVINQIKETNDLKTLKLAISNKQWLSFVQNLIEK